MNTARPASCSVVTNCMDGCFSRNSAFLASSIARVRLRSTKPLFFDPYTVNRITGSIILIDEGTNETVAAGMIL